MVEDSACQRRRRRQQERERERQGKDTDEIDGLVCVRLCLCGCFVLFAGLLGFVVVCVSILALIGSRHTDTQTHRHAQTRTRTDTSKQQHGQPKSELELIGFYINQMESQLNFHQLHNMPFHVTLIPTITLILVLGRHSSQNITTHKLRRSMRNHNK